MRVLRTIGICLSSMNLEIVQEEQTIEELRALLYAELEKNKNAEILIQEKESEAQCAVAWAQTASETVNALEAQLDELEQELNNAHVELQKYKEQALPSKSKDDAMLDIFQQLQESQNREIEMFQQAEDMQKMLLEAQEKLDERNSACAQYQEENRKLQENLSAALQRETQLVSQCKNTATLWDTYNQVRGEMDRTLTSHLTAAGIKKQNGVGDKVISREAYRYEEDIHELEIMLAQADTTLIEERNKRAKLEEENATLHKQILDLQRQVHKL